MKSNLDDKKHPVVSIVIPAYGGADTIGEAVESVLNQSYPHLECLVVNDCSPDHTNDVLARYSDPRLVVLQHETNQGANSARQTALEVSTGDYIAFLDQDDLYHPEKLAVIVDFFEKNPEIGGAYNGRFDIHDSPDDIFRIWMPPPQLSLTEMIISFPFAPSDTVFRRKWALRKDIWDWQNAAGEEVIVNGGEYIYCGRLTFAGCKFAGVERALNYRRHHPGRVFSDLAKRCQSELTCQRLILDDPRCPPETRAAADLAYAMSYRIWAFFAFAQEELANGRSFLTEALRLAPQLRDDLIDFMIFNAIADVGRPFKHTLAAFFEGLPPAAAGLKNRADAAMARAALLFGANEVIWGRPEVGRTALAEAAASGAEIDNRFVQKIVHQITVLEREWGPEQVAPLVTNLVQALAQGGFAGSLRGLRGTVAVNQAFNRYQAQEFRRVPGNVLQAMIQEPRYLKNRGLWSIFGRSLAKIL